jgi:hypothetical protein
VTIRKEKGEKKGLVEVVKSERLGELITMAEGLSFRVLRFSKMPALGSNKSGVLSRCLCQGAG